MSRCNLYCRLLARWQEWSLHDISKCFYNSSKLTTVHSRTVFSPTYVLHGHRVKAQHDIRGALLADTIEILRLLHLAITAAL